MKVSLPGTAWVALIVALTGALGGWLNQYIQEPWVPLSIMVLSLIAKWAEIYLTDKKETEVLAVGLEPERSVVSRLFLG